MQRITLFLLIMVTVVLPVTHSVAATDLERLTTENSLLRAEIDLARKGQVYLTLNPARRQMEIRAGGLVMTTIPVEEIRPWGPYPEGGLHIIADKDRVPEREKIKIPPPGGEEESKPAAPAVPPDPNAKPGERKIEIQATEVTDMPGNYSLWLEGGGVIAVRSYGNAKTWQEKLQQKYEKPLWNLDHAWKAVRAARENKPFTELTLVMKPAEAQRLYWALPIGTALLLPAADSY